MYNYSVRIFGTLDPEYFLPTYILDESISFVVRVDLYDEGPAEGNNGTCTFFDELSQEDINIFLEISDAERLRLVKMIKEILNRKDSAKFYLELESTDPEESEEKDIKRDFSESISRKIVNIKFEVETGIKRNYFS